MRPRNIWQYTLGFAIAASVVACGGGEQSTSEKPSSPSAAPAGQKVDTATAGSVTGMAMLEGTAPANEPIKMNADPVCMKQATGVQLQETYVVGSGGALGNVFVYVKDGLGNYVFDTPTEPLMLDQKGCRYLPHVFGIRVNQPVQIVNSDPTLHNIHALPKANKEFNNGQPIQGMKMTHTFTEKEVMLPFKCDVHGWMNAYVGVLDHPYFAVTGADGKFELRSLPPGTYTVEAWHERLGTATEKVTLGDKETKELMFHFKAPATATD